MDRVVYISFDDLETRLAKHVGAVLSFGKVQVACKDCRGRGFTLSGHGSCTLCRGVGHRDEHEVL